MLAPDQNSDSPYAVIGAGELVSHLRRTIVDEATCKYHFNLFRTGTDGRVTHSFRPEDLRDVVKLCQVMAFAIADDGWASEGWQRELIQLERELAQITERWSDSHDG